MGDFGLFESDEATQAEPRLAARTAARKLDAAIDAVRTDFGRFLQGATGIDEFEDRWHLSKHDIRAAVEPLVFPNTGTMRRIKNALKADWKLAHPYKVAGPIVHDDISLLNGMQSPDDKERNRFTIQNIPGAHPGGPSKAIFNHDATELLSADGAHHWASRHYAEDRDAPIQDIQETFAPSGGNLIPDGNFAAYEDSVDQGGPEKVQRDFTPGGDSGSAKNARRMVAKMCAYCNEEEATGTSPDGKPECKHCHNSSYADDDDNKKEAARLVADIYTDFARSNGLRVASLDTLDLYASTGIHEADYRLLQSMIISAAEKKDDDGDEDTEDDSDDGTEEDTDDEGGEAPDFGGSDDHEEPDADNAGGESDGDEDNESDGEDDSDDEDYDFGGSDDEGGEAAGGDAAGQQFTVPEQAPELSPQLMGEIPQNDPQGAAPVPPEVIDSLLGLPEGTIEQLLLEEAQGGAPDQGAPQGGGDDFFGGGGDEPEQVPPHVARLLQAAPDEAEGDLMTRQRQQQRDSFDTKFGPRPQPQAKPDIAELTRRAQAGDPESYAVLKGLWQQRGWTAARRFWAADDDSDSGSDSSGGGDSGGGQQAPAQDPTGGMGGGMDPSAMMGGGQPMLPPPGSQAVAPPAPAAPIENQPAEDALLDTANQAIMQMIDRETAEYQQIIGPLSQALQAVQFAQQVEQTEHPMDVTPPQGTVNVDPSQAPGGAQNPQQQLARLIRRAKKDQVLKNAATLIANTYGVSERMLVEAMGRRQYEHVAEAFHILPQAALQTPEVRAAASHIAEMFHAENKMFNKPAFLQSVLGPASGSRLPFEQARAAGVRQAGETWKNTPTMDAYEVNNPQPEITDNMTINDLPDFKFKGLPKRRKNSRVALDLGTKVQRWLQKQTENGLNTGGDPMAEKYLNTHKVGPRGSEIVHQVSGAPAHPTVQEPPNPKATPAKAVNPVTKKGTWGEWEPTKQASFFTRKVPGWKVSSTDGELGTSAGPSGVRGQRPGADSFGGSDGSSPQRRPHLARQDVESGGWETRLSGRDSRNKEAGDRSFSSGQDFFGSEDGWHGNPSPQRGASRQSAGQFGLWHQVGERPGHGVSRDSVVPGENSLPGRPLAARTQLGDTPAEAGMEVVQDMHRRSSVGEASSGNGFPDRGEPVLPEDHGRKLAWTGFGPNVFMRKVPGWSWDSHLSGYISKEGKAFTCSCGQKVAAPSYKNCDCGKIWNITALGSAQHLASDTADFYVAREVPVRPGVVMANKKMAGDDDYIDPYSHDEDWYGPDDKMTEQGHASWKRRFDVCPHCGGIGGIHTHTCRAEQEAQAADWNPDDNVDPFDPRLIGAAKKSYRELLAEIERLADWTKYDDDVDPAVEVYGKNKPPSTSVSQPPKDWAKRKPAGDPSKKGGTWTPPTIPRKSK